MKQALIFDGKVVDVADTRFDVAPSLVWKDAPDSVTHGMLDNGDGTFSNPPPSPEPVPEAISKLQLKYALGADWSTVKAYIDADPSLLEDWNLASEIHRASTLVNTAATAIGYSPEQMDDIFRAGAGIAV